jgi:hypothetical protein
MNTSEDEVRWRAYRLCEERGCEDGGQRRIDCKLKPK